MPRHLFICLLLALYVTSAEAAPVRMSPLQAKTTAAALFTHIAKKWNSPLYRLSRDKNNNFFIRAVDGKNKDITSAATIKSWRRMGYNAFPGWRQARLAPRGNYNYFELYHPKVLSPHHVIWHCDLGRTNLLGSGFEDRLQTSTVWVRRIGRNWKVEKWKVNWDNG